MSNNQRRKVGIVGTAVGGLLAAPLISLLTSPLASADPEDAASIIGGGGGDVTTATYSALGITDALSNNAATGGFDNLTTDGSTALDIFDGPGTYGVVFTDGDIFQEGYEVVNGTFIPIDVLNPALPVDIDPGYDLIGGSGAVGAEAIAGLDALFGI